MSIMQENSEMIIFYRDGCNTANIYLPKRDLLISEKDSRWYVEQENLDTEERFEAARSISRALESDDFSDIKGVVYVHSMRITTTEADSTIGQITRSEIPDIISLLDV